MDTIGLKSQNAASTGDSGSASGAAKSATAAHSRPSRKSRQERYFQNLTERHAKRSGANPVNGVELLPKSGLIGDWLQRGERAAVVN